MALGTVLDVAIGIVFFFALMAIIASAVQEIFASVLSTRGKVLQDMLGQILSHQPDPPNMPVADATDLATKVLGHPLIAKLATPNLPAWLSSRIGSTILPSYILSANFATALIEALR